MQKYSYTGYNTRMTDTQNDMSTYKCHFCTVCDGRGCKGQMPGMGGPNDSRNFILNYDSWEEISTKLKDKIEKDISLPTIRLAPMTGAVENVGYRDEDSFYKDLVFACISADIKICIGDGTPDSKLLYGIEAVKATQKKASVFIKPYPDAKIKERIEWAIPVADAYGIDIDSYNIITMRNLVHLEKKTASQLLELKKLVNSKGLPFAIKGIFTKDDVELVKQVKPDICYISNHGGRVGTVKGGVAWFLEEHKSTLKGNSQSLWIDGGIRTSQHIKAAAYLGADSILLGRPLATALCKGGTLEVKRLLSSTLNLENGNTF